MQPGMPQSDPDPVWTRRTFLAEGTGAVLAGSVAAHHFAHGRRSWWRLPSGLDRPSSFQAEALRVLGATRLRHPDSLPDATIAEGTDTLPEIEHVVVLMMENHSYDNILGMLGREGGQRPRGDGYRLALDGLPTATNPYPNGTPCRAFHMPTTCQLGGQPSQEWTASHTAYNNGKMDGFVLATISPDSKTTCGPVAMGYWTGADLPLTYALAQTFPIGDRWFCSCLGQTDPNRRFLIAGTSSGMTGDVGGNPDGDAGLAVPAANGTIFNRLTQAGISWADYATNTTTSATQNLYPANDGAYVETNIKPLAQFFTDAKAGSLPSFTMIDEDFGSQSQENPQNITVGEGFIGQVIDALRDSPLWPKTLLIINYDEHGGYYDHVPPPAALAPDAVPVQVLPGESTYDGFRRYGFRVPSILVGPYVKPGYVSHVVYDHTSILAFVERKWNLKAMTYRDANANDLTDFLDLDALHAGQPTFPELPVLAAAGNDAARLACTKTGPGTIPAPNPAQTLSISSAKIDVRRRRAVAELRTDRGTLVGLQVELVHGANVVARTHVKAVGFKTHRIVLRLRATTMKPGRYTLVVRQGTVTLAQREVTVRAPRAPHMKASASA